MKYKAFLFVRPRGFPPPFEMEVEGTPEEIVTKDGHKFKKTGQLDEKMISFYMLDGTLV